ncbi:hypothetical protein [Anaeromyxobacter sp. K]|uniref:hypothetical protein n=1 Tax=Anaeromyxobacter sp. (strain K) TaxID=447217 RepID=UPI001E2BFF05|nr:hypothetical protein [Anaeromyxobacter sp. K]
MRAATYTIQASPPTDPTLAQKLQALASKRQLLAHQSVGNNILYGNGTGGLDGLLDANPGSGVTIAYHPASAAAVPVGAVADTAIGVNGQPVGKVLDFDAQVRTRFGGALDYFGFKFCFTDIWTAQDVSDTWAQYQATMDALEAAYPGKIIYWTVPLMPDVTDIDGNTQREALSNHIREKYGGTGRVFDLAYHESHDAQGNPFTLGGVPALAHDWSADGGHDAHLNAAGATMVATRWVEFMYRVATGAAP